jgi:hypothetical protein
MKEGMTIPFRGRAISPACGSAKNIFPFGIFELRESVRVARSCHLQRPSNGAHCRRVCEQLFIPVTSRDAI